MPTPAPEQLGDTGRDRYVATQATPEFQELRSGFRRFVFPVAAFFLVWYFAYVLLAAFAKDFMATPVVGNIRLGLVLGLLQFVSTFVITVLYVRWADRSFDPRADALREELQRGDGAQPGPDPTHSPGVDLPEVLDGVFDRPETLRDTPRGPAPLTADEEDLR